MIILTKHLKIDEESLRIREDQLLTNLNLALENHIKCLEITSKYDLKVFRVVSLWLQQVNLVEPNDKVRFNFYHKFFNFLWYLILIRIGLKSL